MAIAADNSLGSLGSILSSIPGLSEALNGSTSTSSTNISSAGMTYLLQQLLSSNQGLAAVSSGQNAAGLYNSTVQSQMVNNLLTNAAGEVASKDTTTTTTKAPTINLGQTILEGAAGIIGNKVLTKGMGELDNTSLAQALGIGNSSTAASSVAAGTQLTGGAIGADSFSVAGAAPTAIADASASGAAASEASIAGGTAAGNAATSAGIGAALGATGAGALDATTAGAIGAATAGGLSAGGAALGGISGAVAGDVAADTAAIAGAEGVGTAAAAGGFGDALASIGAALAWVVCTELESTGEMSHDTYVQASPDFICRMRLKPSVVRGYHYWAIPYTKLMRRKDWIGRLARKAMRPIANGRAQYILGNWNVCGWVSFYIIEPICSLLGNTVARRPQNWKSLYEEKK